MSNITGTRNDTELIADVLREIEVERRARFTGIECMTCDNPDAVTRARFSYGDGVLAGNVCAVCFEQILKDGALLSSATVSPLDGPDVSGLGYPVRTPENVPEGKYGARNAIQRSATNTDGTEIDSLLQANADADYEDFRDSLQAERAEALSARAVSLAVADDNDVCDVCDKTATRRARLAGAVAFLCDTPHEKG